MKTKLTKSPEDAAGYIRSGGIVAFPTETVYGLGANVFDPAALVRIFEAKGRPSDNPLITHVYEHSQVSELTAAVTPNAQSLIDAFMPGPLTIVLEKAGRVPGLATAGLPTIGIRMPGAAIARSFLQQCGVAVAAPSANLSGRPSPTTWQAVLEDLDGRIACILQGEPSEIGLESTVVDCTDEDPIVLRQGAVSLEELRRVLPRTRPLGADPSLAVRSPGLLHKHYAPRALVRIVVHPAEIGSFDKAAYIGLATSPSGLAYALVCPSVAEYAHSLFEFFRECDRIGVGTIYCQAVEGVGLGGALMDRINRSAER